MLSLLAFYYVLYSAVNLHTAVQVNHVCYPGQQSAHRAEDRDASGDSGTGRSREDKYPLQAEAERVHGSDTNHRLQRRVSRVQERALQHLGHRGTTQAAPSVETLLSQYTGAVGYRVLL